MSSQPAAGPICCVVGSKPTSNVATPIKVSVATSVDLRPTRSPMYPKMAPPKGRDRKPTKIVANDSMRPSELPCAKNSLGKIRRLRCRR
jgi:hypothetical protein